MIAIAGAGRVAQALGRLLHARGERVAAVASRDLVRAQAAVAFIGGGEAVPYAELAGHADHVVIAVSDSAIAQVSKEVRGAVVLHTCGSRGAEILVAPARAQWHPLQSIATPEQGVAALPGSWFGISGDAEAVGFAEHLTALLGGRALRIPPGRTALYHAAAAMASNYVVALIDAAAILMGVAGIAERDALAALAPLVHAAGANALRLGPAAALTGPIERGDLETVELHRTALAAAPPAVRELYRAAGVQALEIARRRGLDEAQARKLEEILNG